MQKGTIKQWFVSVGMILISIMPIYSQTSAEQWLEKASTLFKNKGIEVSFLLNENGVRLNGKLIMEGNSYLFDTDEMKVWFDGQTQWTLQVSPSFTELYISEPTLEDQQSINPYLLLDSYKKNFKVSLGESQTSKTGAIHEIILTAQNTQQDLSSLSIYMKNNGEPTALTLHFPDERVYQITVRSFRNGLTFPKDKFTYSSKAYPTDEIIDMR